MLFQMHTRATAVACASLFAIGVTVDSIAEPALEPATGQVESSPMIVTASRVAESIDDTLWSTTVIDRAQIEALQVTSVPELLKGIGGLTAINSGGLGKLTNVFMRGTDSDQVLVLVDGVRIGSATAGTTAFEFLPLEQIERVEIVRGPRSTLYGSEAVGGVIQFFTRKAGQPGMSLNASAGAGSHSTWRNSAGLSFNGGNGWLNLSADRAESDGINACRGSGGCFTVEPDADGFDSLNGSLRTGYRFGENAEVELRFLNADGDSEFDGSFINSVDFVQRATSVQGRFDLPQSWKLTALAGRGEDRQDNFLDGAWQSNFDTRRDSASVQLDRNGLSVGFDYYTDKVTSSEAFEETERDNKAAFAQFMTKTGAHSWLAGVRRDDNEQFGGHTTGNIGWGWAFAPNLRLSATAGTAFKAPSFNDLYFPGFSNPNLHPEESRSYELGLTGMPGVARWSLRAYRTEVKDLIAFDSILFIPINLDEALAQGVEAQLEWTVAETDVSLQAGWLDTENRSNGTNRGNKLNRRPDESASLNVRRQFGPVLLGATGIYEGRRFDNLANTRELGSFFTLDLTAEVEFARHWSIGARAANVLDREYSTIAFYNQDDRNWSLTVRYR